MFEFFQKAATNLFKAFWVCFGIFFFSMFVLLVIVGLTKEMDAFVNSQMLLYLVPFSIGLSLLTMSVAFFTEYLEFRRLKKMFSRTPFSSFHEIGFEKIRLFKKSLWKLYKEVYVARINGFNIVADFVGRDIGSLTLLSPNVSNVAALRIQLPRESELSVSSLGIVITVPVDSFWTPTAQTLDTLLRSTTESMLSLGYRPTDGLKSYEDKLKWESITRGFGG